jgi:hypothetical protein
MFSKSKKAKGPRTDSQSSSDDLPIGAEAAIWSILEVLPDPRNHLALTRDPTAEVRLSPAAISEAMAMARVEPADHAVEASVEPAAPTAPVQVTPRASTLDLDLDQIQTVAPDPAIDLRTRPAELAWALNHELEQSTAGQPRPAGIRWSADTAEVRLPSLSTPQPARPVAPGEPDRPAWPGDALQPDATVHPIDPSKTDPSKTDSSKTDPSKTDPSDANRYARGA